MLECKAEVERRVEFIKECLKEAGAEGIVFGNSGGKDSCLVGILSKMACDNTLAVQMPCESKRNYTIDYDDGVNFAGQFGIESVTVDLTEPKRALKRELEKVAKIEGMADVNINPRLRMNALYALARSRNALVAGTGNRSECYMGYFTKWGDGAFDFNPIADLTVKEVYALLEYLHAPRAIIDKAPSAGLYEGQTDEAEMGIKYSQLDEYLLTGKGEPEIVGKIERAHRKSLHKLRLGKTFCD